jgi:hypothetical protein
LLWVSIAMIGVSTIYCFAAGFEKPWLFLGAICNAGLLWGIVRGSRLAFVLALAIILAALGYTALQANDRFLFVLISNSIVVIPMIIERNHFFGKHQPVTPRQRSRG